MSSEKTTHQTFRRMRSSKCAQTERGLLRGQRPSERGEYMHSSELLIRWEPTNKAKVPKEENRSSVCPGPLPLLV